MWRLHAIPQKTRQKSQERITKKTQVLNRDLVFVSKTVPKNKMILLGVPHQYVESQIKQAILTNFKAYEDEITFLAAHKSKRNSDTKNWIIVLPRALGKTIVQENGLTIGLHFCRIRMLQKRCSAAETIRTFRTPQSFTKTELSAQTAPKNMNPGRATISCCVSTVFTNITKTAHSIRRVTSPLILPARF